MIDITKQYQTRDGRKARILCTDGPGTYPVIGLIDGWPMPTTWTPEGKINSVFDSNPGDLIEAPKVITGWVNMYRYTDGPGASTRIFPTREEADLYAGGCGPSPQYRIACIQVTFKEGDGL